MVRCIFPYEDHTEEIIIFGVHLISSCIPLFLKLIMIIYCIYTLLLMANIYLSPCLNVLDFARGFYT
jgi:hypothetical protein